MFRLEFSNVGKSNSQKLIHISWKGNLEYQQTDAQVELTKLLK